MERYTVYPVFKVIFLKQPPALNSHRMAYLNFVLMYISVNQSVVVFLSGNFLYAPLGWLLNTGLTVLYKKAPFKLTLGNYHVNCYKPFPFEFRVHQHCIYITC